MANIDISSKFSNEKPTIKLSDDLILSINDGHKNVLIVNTLMNNNKLSEADRMSKILDQLLGKNATEKIDKLNLRFLDYQKIFFGVMAAINDESYEDVESRFRSTKK